MDTQEEEFRMSMNLPYIEGTSEEVRRILRSHKVRSTFYTENTLRKLLCKPKMEQLQKMKAILFMKLSVVTTKQSTLNNLKRSFKLRSAENKISAQNCDCDNNEIAKHC